MKVLWWLRRDSRLTDHEGIEWLIEHGHQVLVLALLPETKQGPALSFWWQSLTDLRDQLSERGISVFVVRGDPEVVVANWAIANHCEAVLCTPETNSRDISVERTVEKYVEKAAKGARLVRLGRRTLLPASGLPFSLSELPLVFGNFRRKIEFRKLLEVPRTYDLNRLQGFAPTIPLGADLISGPESFPELPFDLKGGARSAQKRLEEYFFILKGIAYYKETRNGMLKRDDSSKLSPWLADGSLSPSEVAASLLAFEKQVGPNESTEWFWQELLWRDYFKFLAAKCGDAFFDLQGLRTEPQFWKADPELFERWTQGRIGEDFVDANMLELKTTGWMSNRGRQNVASYLAKELRLPWTWGAQWFQDHLLDEDPESNGGNWLYLSGMGTDPRDRKFNVREQAERYDPEGAYRSRWLA